MPTETGEKRTRIAQFIENRISELKGVRSQKDIAALVGFNSTNMITMLKQGDTKLALDRAPALAKALDSDPAFVFRLAMEQFYAKETVDSFYDVVGFPLTQNERALIEAVRGATGDDNSEISPIKIEQIAALLATSH